MEQILPTASAIPGYSEEILLTLPFPDLVNLCKTSKELENKIDRESFWEKKAQADYSFLEDKDEPPNGFDTWLEYLTYRYTLRKTIKDLIHRCLNVEAYMIREDDENERKLAILTFATDEDNEDEPQYHLRMTRREYFPDQNTGEQTAEISIVYINHDHHADDLSWRFSKVNLDNELPKIFQLLDRFDLRNIGFKNRGAYLASLNYSVVGEY